MKKILGMGVVLALALAAAPARAQHTVLITWTASASAAANPSLTYNIYRSTSCTGTFVLLNGGLISTTSFTDENVFSSATYCYQVTAVLSGTESVASNQATAVIPPSPPARADEHRKCGRGGAERAASSGCGLA